MFLRLNRDQTGLQPKHRQIFSPSKANKLDRACSTSQCVKTCFSLSLLLKADQAHFHSHITCQVTRGHKGNLTNRHMWGRVSQRQNVSM